MTDTDSINMITECDRAFFRRNGFLVIKGAASAEVCAHLVEKTWQRLPAHWDRSDPETWVGQVTDSCHTSPLAYRRGHLKFQKGELLTDPLVLDSFGPKSPLGRISASMLGATPVTRYRGLYCIAPFAEHDRVRRISAPHVEAHPVQIIALTYLDDVDMDGGGLLVWPGSHVPLYGAFDSKLEFVENAGYAATFKRYSCLEPLEIPGCRGDSVIIHHRLLHAPSLNKTRKIRFAILTDYLSADFKRLAREVPGSRLWEDWPPMRCEAADEEVSEYELKTQVPGLGPAWSPIAENDSTLNKRDASSLVRALRPGDVWLTISDSPALHQTIRIEPCGSRAGLAGATVSACSRALISVTKCDFVARLHSEDEIPELTVSQDSSELHYRRVRVALPLSDSICIERGVIPALKRGSIFRIERGSRASHI